MKRIEIRAWHVANSEMIDSDELAFDYYEPLRDQLTDSDEIKFILSAVKPRRSGRGYQAVS